jgi:hypothetical protein
MGVGVGTAGRAENSGTIRAVSYSTTEVLLRGGDASRAVGAGVVLSFSNTSVIRGMSASASSHEKSSSLALVVLLNQYNSSRRFASASASYRS